MKPDFFSVWRRLSLAAVTLFALLAGCSLPSSAGGVLVWIDVPLDGLVFPTLQPINIEGHASSAGGISRVEIWINSALLTTINNPPMEGRLASFRAEWMPSAAGKYIIQVLAFSAEGNASASDSARVAFGGEAVTPVSGCPTPVGGGPTPVSCGPEITGCPSPVGGGPTPVNCVTLPPPPVVTDTPTLPPPPSVLIQFWADPAEIQAGACTDIRWHVENVSRVVFGGVDQPFDGSYRDCLCASQRYTLTVIHLDGSEEKRAVDVVVSGSCITPTSPPPADTTPPTAPTLAVPANGLTIACKASQNLVWLPVDDPSGIGEYQVQVQRHSGDNNWQDVPGSVFTGVQGKQLAVNVECGWYYRWRVRAIDGAGNVGPWSGWWQFVISLM